MIKVLVSGAFSTGKTTLCAALGDKLEQDGRRVIRLPDVARRRPLSLNRAQTENSSLWLLTTQVAAEIEASEKPVDVVLCDRGVPDVFAHILDIAARAGGGRFSASIAPFAKAWLPTYDLILATRVDRGRAPEPDGIRDPDPEYRDVMAGWSERTLRGARSVQPVDPAEDVSAQASMAADAVCRLLTN